MRRRKFLVIAGCAAAWSLGASAQRAEVRRVGVLMGPAETDAEGQARITAFRQGLSKLGWTEGSNVTIDYRWAAANPRLIKQFAEELVTLGPDVILANGTPVVAALKQATRSIPIVFALVNEPVAQVFVSNISRPGGNITGFAYIDFSVVGKSLEILKQAAPGLDTVSLMFNPATYPYYDVYLRSFEADPRSASVRVLRTAVSSKSEIAEAVSRMVTALPTWVSWFRPIPLTRRTSIPLRN